MVGLLGDQNQKKSTYDLSGFYGTKRRKKNGPTGFSMQNAKAPEGRKIIKSLVKDLVSRHFLFSLSHTK